MTRRYLFFFPQLIRKLGLFHLSLTFFPFLRFIYLFLPLPFLSFIRLMTFTLRNQPNACLFSPPGHFFVERLSALKRGPIMGERTSSVSRFKGPRLFVFLITTRFLTHNTNAHLTFREAHLPQVTMSPGGSFPHMSIKEAALHSNK